VATGVDPFLIQGSAASGAANSGNPVKIGAVYNATLSAVTTGNRTDLQTNAFGELAVRSRNKFTRVTGNATTTVKTGAGILSQVCWGTVGANGSTATVYDNTSAAAPIITVMTPVNAQNSQCFKFDLDVATGITIVTTGSANNDITITYQ